MNPDEKRFVKVRVNASGRRFIGIVAFETHFPRFSDFLNAFEPFLIVKQERVDVAVQKDAISYLEPLEETTTGARSPRPGAFRRVELEIAGIPGVLSGELFLPEESTLVEVLGDERRFLPLRDVAFTETAERYHWLGVPKRAIVLLRMAGR